MKAKCFYSFTQRHLRPSFRHRCEGSEGKKHDLIVYVRARAREKQRVRTKNEVKEMATTGRRNSAGGCSIIKKLLHHQKSKNSLLLRFLSYAVPLTSEIVFSTSEVDFSVSELFSAVVVGGHIAATLSVSDIRPLQRRSLRCRAVRRFVVALVYG